MTGKAAPSPPPASYWSVLEFFPSQSSSVENRWDPSSGLLLRFIAEDEPKAANIWSSSVEDFAVLVARAARLPSVQED